jgi:hypothetical protein
VTCGLLLAATVGAQARLGENAEQLEARFGKPTLRIAGEPAEGNLPILGFNKQNIEIRVVLKDGISIGEIYRSKDPLTTQQIDALLQANSQGQQWSLADRDRWQRTDGSIADYRNNALAIRSKTLLDIVSQLEQAQKPSVQGF